MKRRFKDQESDATALLRLSISRILKNPVLQASRFRQSGRMSGKGRTFYFRSAQVKVWNRRVSLVATRSGEGLLTEPVPGTRLRSRELALMPHTGPWFEFE